MPSERLPIFPLEQVVLFPRVRCPLHIFEPRYRQMTEHALDGDRRIGMVAVRPEHLGEMAGDPPVFSVGCEGRIVESARLSDGRYEIVLLGEQRFRIREERQRPRDQLYRTALVDPLTEPLRPEEGPRVTALRARSLELVARVLEHTHAGAARRLEPERFSAVDDATLINALCQLVDLAPPEKQSLLEAEGPALRGRSLIELLEFRLAELEGPVGPASHGVH